jgi:hypothetical protein
VNEEAIAHWMAVAPNKKIIKKIRESIAMTHFTPPAEVNVG